MTQSDTDKPTDPIPPEKQPPALRDLVSAINAARRQSSLYGADHPNTLQAAGELSSAIDEFVSSFERATLIFTRKAVIANEHSYIASADSQELFERLRARGVMAITLVGSAGPEQAAAFLAFLNAEPSRIRAHGGASAYLRKLAVTKIVATDAVYTSGEEFENELDDGSTSRADWGTDNVDRAVGAAIDWLSRQADEGEEEPPRLPIADILSRPDQAAKLIREAVTKLHASRKQETSGELASEVVHDLKDLAGSDKEKWDKSTLQIRKAISKLPKGIRPEMRGFSEEDDPDSETAPASAGRTADIREVEAKVAELLAEARNLRRKDGFPTPEALGSLFGARADGLLSDWRRELQPGSVMESSGKTLETLMNWEGRAVEHERIARALAGLIPRAVEMGDMTSARRISASLITEMKREDPLNWRSMSAKASLASLDRKSLRPVVEDALASGDIPARETASALVETLPQLALEMVDVLGSSGVPAFNESLKRAIVDCGPAAISPLARLLREGTGASREMALEVLIGMKGAAAIREVAQVLSGAAPEFVVGALKLLPAVRIPQVTDLCVAHVAHSSPEVRCAALGALGELADESSVPVIAQVALRRSLGKDDTAEKIQAVQALAKMDRPEALDCLARMANRRPLLGRSRYEAVRLAAERALSEARSRQAPTQSRAA